jgi:hypothetical protein
MKIMVSTIVYEMLALRDIIKKKPLTYRKLTGMTGNRQN